MKINFQVGLLVLSIFVAIAYFTLPKQPNEKHPSQIANPEQTDSEKKSLAKASIYGVERFSTESSPNKHSEEVWQPIAQQQRPITLPDDLRVEYIKVAENSTMTFSEGQKVSFFIPQENSSYFGKINESTFAFGGNVKISSGDIENGNELASFSITEGKNTTFVVIATGKSIYQVEIDNSTGIGVVLDDRELDLYRQHDDAILPPPEGVS